MSEYRNYVVVRQSPDWRALGTEEFEAQARAFCRMVKEPVESVVEAARLWDHTFGIGFRETRAVMKDIALANLRMVRDAELWFAPADALPEVVPGGIYFFCDDDDWAHPDIFRVLRENVDPDACEGYVWPHIAFGRSEGAVLRVREDDARCHTNNYAVSSAWLRSGPDAAVRVYQHFDADRIFPKLRVCRVPEPLSATNKNPSSTMFLRHNLRADPTPERLVAMVEEFCRRLRLPANPSDPDEGRYGWARPSGAAVREFYERLLASRR